MLGIYRICDGIASMPHIFSLRDWKASESSALEYGFSLFLGVIVLAILSFILLVFVIGVIVTFIRFWQAILPVMALLLCCLAIGCIRTRGVMKRHEARAKRI